MFHQGLLNVQVQSFYKKTECRMSTKTLEIILQLPKLVVYVSSMTELYTNLKFKTGDITFNTWITNQSDGMKTNLSPSHKFNIEDLYFCSFC